MEPERVVRRHLKPDERRRVAELCERSGLTHREFAAQHDLSLSSLQRWLSEARSGSEEVPALIFREVAVSPPETASASVTWAVELVGPAGITVRFRDRLPLEDLIQLLRGRAC